MFPETLHWLNGLREHVDDSRLRCGPAPEVPAAVYAAERALLATHLVAWLDTELAGLLAEREAVSHGPDPDPDPAIVLTTTGTGLAAATDVLGRDDPLMRDHRRRFACVTEREYRLWCMRHPDPGHRMHINHWNWLKTRVPPQRWPAFSRYPLREGEVYWLHRTGTTGVGRDRRFCHLWKWNGAVASLVKPFIDEAVQGL